MLSEKEKDSIVRDSIVLCRLIISSTYTNTHEFNNTVTTMIIKPEEISDKAQNILNQL